MKKIFAFTVFAILALAITMLVSMPVQAVTSGQSIGNESATIYNGTPGATTPTVVATKTYDYVMNSIGCDIIATPTSAATGTFLILSNMGSSSTNFDTSVPLISTGTYTTGSAIVTKYAIDHPFRTISLSISAGTTTVKYQVNCGTIQ